MSLKRTFLSILFVLIAMPANAWKVLPEFSNTQYDILVLERPTGVIIYGIRCKNGGTLCEYNFKNLCKEGVARSSDPDGNIISWPGYSRDKDNRPIEMFICATSEQLKKATKPSRAETPNISKAKPPIEPAQNGNNIIAMFKGKTVSGKHVQKGFIFKVYFSSDGTLIEVRDSGKRKKGKWTLSESGNLCIIWKNKTACGQLKQNNDSSYSFIRNGKTARRYESFQEGNTL